MESSNNSETSTATPQQHVADANWDDKVRITVLYINIVVGVIGGLFVILWLFNNRHRKSRVNTLIRHVAAADLFVMLGACLPQLVWEIYERNWALGGFLCKTMKLTMIFALFSSNYMLVVLSIDRHQAIRAPLKEPIAVSMGSKRIVNKNM